VVVVGKLLRGMSTTVVVPPAAAADVAVSIPENRHNHNSTRAE
jgi:hypothetical protein